MIKIDYSVIGKAMMHPVQQQILETLADRRDDGLGQPDASPTELAEQLGGQVSQTAYHFKALRDRGWISCTREEPRRGAMEHFYALTDELVGVVNDPEERQS